jgi:hypothetical protein
MADRERTVWKLKRGIYEVTEWGEVVVTTGDTVTFSNLFATKNPYNAVFWKMSDGTVVSNTHVAGTNVCTIGQDETPVDVTDEKCIYMAYGVKA